MGRDLSRAQNTTYIISHKRSNITLLHLNKEYTSTDRTKRYKVLFSTITLNMKSTSLSSLRSYGWYTVFQKSSSLSSPKYRPDTFTITFTITLFGFLRVEGKKMVLGVWTDGFCTKTVTLRYLTCAALVKVRNVT